MFTPQEAEELYNKVEVLSNSHSELLREFTELKLHIDKLNLAKAEVYDKIKDVRVEIKKIASSL